MLIFQDIFTDDELFTDAQKMKKDFCDALIVVTCKDICKEENADFDIGQNASQEEQAEQYDKHVEMGIDVVLNQHLEEITHFYPKKKDYKLYLKGYCKKIMPKVKAAGDEQVENFKAAANFLVELVDNHFDELQFFSAELKGEEMPFHIPFRRCCENNECTMYFLSHGLKEVKF